MLFTVMARKIGTFGQKVEVFGISATAFSLAALVAAPYMGMLADRFGRRRLLLGSLVAHALASLGYLMASTRVTFIALRAVAGGLTAGLVPATIGMIGDLAPQAERGRWIGLVTGWSAIGFVLGPPLGGWIFDQWGLAVPFFAGAVAHTLAFLIALWLIPNTIPRLVRESEGNLGTTTEKTGILPRLYSSWTTIPRSYHTLVMLGIISFLAVFAWRFVEPQFHFFIYDVLGWTSARFGLVMSGYAVLLMFAETTLGALSDRFGRRPILMIGLVIHTAQYITLITTGSLIWITLGIAASGLGEGLFMPALNAYFLDITPEPYRARVIGFKESMFSLAGLAGPVLVVLAVQYLQPVGIFIIAGALILFSSFLVPLSSQTANHRRLAIPAVFGCIDATTCLRSGGRGTVEILEIGDSIEV
jgi:DHA1 family multidrug resistance protein-like MFS transporter